MRWRFFSSALAAVLVVAGCGNGATRERAAPYAYDTNVPLAVRVGPALNPTGPVRIHDVAYRGANGKRVLGFLVEPTTKGAHPVALLLHGSGGTRLDMLYAAGAIASRGAVAMTISSPNDAETMRPLVVDARRALDVLLSRPNVARDRVGLVGFSLGAQTAAIVAGVDERPTAVALLAARGTDLTLRFLPRTHAALLIEDALRDEVIPRAELRSLIRAAPGEPTVRWFDTGHQLGSAAGEAMVRWIADQLRLRGA